MKSKPTQDPLQRETLANGQTRQRKGKVTTSPKVKVKAKTKVKVKVKVKQSFILRATLFMNALTDFGLSFWCASIRKSFDTLPLVQTLSRLL